MPWTETQSLSFSARHDASDAEAAAAVLDRLEGFREELEGRFERTPWDVAVVIHPRPALLALAHPWLPLARMFAAPASRRYLAGWFASGEIHVLSSAALEARASNVPGSLDALRLTPLHEYAHLVLGANNEQLPPPFSPRSFARYVRWAWLCEGAATWLSGQAPHLRPAIARRLREGPRPSFPPSPRDAPLLGGTVFTLLADVRGDDACIELASQLDGGGSEAAIVRAFGRQPLEVERAWRDHLDGFTLS